MSRDDRRAQGNALYWSCADVLLLASQLPNARLPSPAELRQRLIGLLDGMVATARSNGLADDDIAEARYALVAFIDEQILKSDWPGRSEWMKQPLQLQLYREVTAGENFFERLRALLHSGKRPLALEAYYLCLTLGFRGASGAHGEQSSPAQYAANAHGVLARAFPQASQLSPNARLRDRANPERHSKVPFLAWIAACASLALGSWFFFQWSIDRTVRTTLDRVPALQVSTP